jgi:secondary thiamine-phosphate synthase enzyme
MQATFELSTTGSGLCEFTSDVQSFLRGQAVETGLLTLFCQHTSCSLVIQENADPDVQRDLDAFFQRLVPDTNDPSMAYLRHRAEGPDDMPAHIKAALTQTSLSIPISNGSLVLGTWQGIYLFEHRMAPHTRRVVAHISA